MGCHPQITARAGPHPPPPQRRPGPAPPRERSLAPTNHPLLGPQAMVSPPFHPGTMPSAPSIHHSRTRFQGGQSRAATPFACGAGTLWRRYAETHYASACFYNLLRSQPKPPRVPTASPLASLSPQRGEGLRVRGGYTSSSHFCRLCRKIHKTPELSLFTP